MLQSFNSFYEIRIWGLDSAFQIRNCPETLDDMFFLRKRGQKADVSVFLKYRWGVPLAPHETGVLLVKGALRHGTTPALPSQGARRRCPRHQGPAGRASPSPRPQPGSLGPLRRPTARQRRARQRPRPRPGGAAATGGPPGHVGLDIYIYIT